VTVATETSRVSYVGNAVTTDFSTDFYFQAAADLVVKYTPSGGVEVVWTLGVDYTVTLPAAVGAAGSIQCTTAPAADSSLVIERDVSFVQDVSFRTAGAFDRAVHEDRFDRLTFMAQELLRRVSDLEGAGVPADMTAGNGLYFSGTVLHVGVEAGKGVKVGPDTLQFWADDAQGNGLASDGGAVLSVAPGDGILVGAVVEVDFATATPGAVSGAAGAVGVGTKAARTDHTHQVTAGNPVSIGTANAPGSGTALAYNDHVHNHGAQTDGSHHAAAVASVAGVGGTAGFITAANEEGLEGLLGDHTKVIARSTNTGQSLAVGTTVVLFPEVVDVLNEYVPGTGVFTATEAGYYQVDCVVGTISAAVSLGDLLTVFVFDSVAGGTLYGTSGQAHAASTLYLSSSVSGLVYLPAGATLSIKATVAGATTLTVANACLTISRAL